MPPWRLMAACATLGMVLLIVSAFLWIRLAAFGAVALSAAPIGGS
jgi:hypothetical protein